MLFMERCCYSNILETRRDGNNLETPKNNRTNGGCSSSLHVATDRSAKPLKTDYISRVTGIVGHTA